MPQIKITKRKDGREVARFRDNQGLVRTSVGGNASFSPTDWVKADQIKQLAEYGIALQVAQARAGIGSDGSPMPPLKGNRTSSAFLARVNGKATFSRKTYADYKAAHGLQPMRDLYGEGKDGHMLDDIRITYLDDRQATISISRKSSRDKAAGNEARAPWWGWSPPSIGKLGQMAAELFGQSAADVLVSLGLVAASSIAATGRFLRRVA